MPKRKMQGTVVSNSGDKTISVLVTRKVQHPVYKKIVTKSSKYMAHDPENKFKEGDVVSIEEHRPISKSKRWIVLYKSENKEGK
jgi:small subunit ribosomal protein S17